MHVGQHHVISLSICPNKLVETKGVDGEILFIRVHALRIRTLRTNSSFVLNSNRRGKERFIYKKVLLVVLHDKQTEKVYFQQGFLLCQ